MSRRTNIDVIVEIAKLKDLKPHVQQFSAFGDDNHKLIELEEQVLAHRNILSEQGVYRFCENNIVGNLPHDVMLDACLHAWRWKEGIEETSPSEGWSHLDNRKFNQEKH